MNTKKYIYLIVIVLVVLLSLAIAVTAEFSLSKITSDPYGFIMRFFEMWVPAIGALGTIFVAIVIFLVLNYIRTPYSGVAR
jgi:uncharacterized membrane protein